MSPGFLKRKAPSSTPFSNSLFDPFADEHDYREYSPTKRTKFGRKSAEWRFADRTPSPILQSDIQVEQQVEQQVEAEIHNSSADQIQGLPTPVSEQEIAVEESKNVLVEEDFQSPISDHQKSLTSPELEAHVEIQDRQTLQDQNPDEDYGPSLEFNSGQSGSVSQIAAQIIDAADEHTEELQTTVSNPSSEPAMSTPIEPSSAATRLTSPKNKDQPTMFTHGTEPSIDGIGTGEMAPLEEAMDDRSAEDSQREEHDSVISEEEAATIEHTISSNRASSPKQTADAYLRHLNAEQVGSRTFDDILRRSNQESLFGSGPYDQKADRIAPGSVVELSSSPVQALSRSQPASEEGSLNIERERELDDHYDGSENENGHWALNSEDDSTEYPTDLYTESEDEAEDEDENQVARMGYVSPQGIPNGTVYDADDLSGKDDVEGQGRSESDESQGPCHHIRFQDQDHDLQHSHDLLDEEGHDSEAERSDDVDEAPDNVSSDSDLIIMEGLPEQVQLGSSGKTLDHDERTSEDVEDSQSTVDNMPRWRRASTFGYDGSSFSRLQSKAEPDKHIAIFESANTETTKIQGAGSTINPNGESGEIRPAASVDQLSNDLPSAHEGVGAASRNLGVFVQNDSKETRAERKDDYSPTSATWVAYDQLQNDGVGLPPAAEHGPGELQLAHDTRSPSEAHITKLTPETLVEIGFDDTGLRAREDDGGLDDRDQISDAESSVRFMAGRSPSLGDSAAAAEDIEDLAEGEELIASEPDDYWEEDDEVSEDEGLSSEIGESEAGEDEENDKSKELRGEGGQLRRNRLGEAFPIKSSTVEIIDLGSSDEEELMVPQIPEPIQPLDPEHSYPESSGDAKPRTAASRQHDTHSLTKETFVPISSIETPIQAQQSTLGSKGLVEHGRESEIEPDAPIAISSKREIHDTYSEDAEFTESELAESRPPSLDQVTVSPSQTRAVGSPQPSSTIKGLAQDVASDTQEQAVDEAVEPSPEPERERVKDELRAGSPDTSLVHSAEAQVLGASPEIEADLLETQLTMRPSRLFQKEIPDSAAEDQSLATSIEETSDAIAAASQLSQYPAPDLDQVDVYMDQDGRPVQLDEDSSEDMAQELSLQDLREELEQRTQLPTPTTTQLAKTRSETSEISLKYEVEEDTLPTPSLTQKTVEIVPAADRRENHIISEPVDESPELKVKGDSPAAPSTIQEAPEVTLPTTPGPSRKVSLVQKLKEMRSESAKKRRSSHMRDTPSAASPWFGPRRSSRLAPDTDEPAVGAEEETGRDGDVSSEVDGESQRLSEPSLIRHNITSPTLAKNLTRLPSSSPLPHPIQQTTGFRTNLSYFAPLNTIRSHYNATTSVLALVIASTPLERATTGPKDYHTTIYITDPSSADSPSVTSARIFRPSRLAFPKTQQGDAILLRSFRVVSYRKQLGLLSTDSSAWAVFHRGEEPQIKGPPVEFGAEERGFARGLWDWWATVEKEDFISAVSKDRAANDRSPKKGRDGKSGKGRASFLKHELRDGTTYVDREKGVDDDSVHELRDGTMWSDSKL